VFARGEVANNHAKAATAATSSAALIQTKLKRDSVKK
jgi:hypothetical protein